MTNLFDRMYRHRLKTVQNPPSKHGPNFVVEQSEKRPPGKPSSLVVHIAISDMSYWFPRTVTGTNREDFVAGSREKCSGDVTASVAFTWPKVAGQYR